MIIHMKNIGKILNQRRAMYGRYRSFFCYDEVCNYETTHDDEHVNRREPTVEQSQNGFH